MKLWQRVAVAAFVAFLFYFCQFLRNGSELNRYLSQWETQDGIAILLGVALFTILAIAADSIVTWSSSRSFRRIFNHLFLIILASGIVNIMGYIGGRPNLTMSCWMAAMFLIGCSFARTQLKFDYYAARICLVFSPAILLIFVTMFSWSTWPNSLENAPRIVSQVAKKTPVYFFVFDEWSFTRSSDDGEIKRSLKNLRELAAKAVYFTEARSPADETLVSLPCYLFQNDKTMEVACGDTFFPDGDSRISTRQVPSLFHTARQNGYRTSLLGFYHSYRQLLGDQVDYCNVYPIYTMSHPKGSLFDTFLWRLKRNAADLYDPFSLHCKFDEREFFRQWFETRTAFRKEMLDVLANSETNCFAFFHSPFPHAPFVSNLDGTFFSTPIIRSEDYMREIRYLDTIVGDIVKTLRSTGKFDEALLIFTSDHSWRVDPDPDVQKLPDFKKRIPLIIKLPGEKTGHVIDKEFCPTQLQPLFEAVFAGEKDTETLLKILENCSSTKN